MRAFQISVNNVDGSVVITYTEGHMHLCIDLDADSFSELAGMINGALGDSKMAAS